MKIKIALISILLVSASSIYVMTPKEKLFENIKEGDIALVEEALKEGTDVNSQNRIGYTALMWAAYFGYDDIVKKLIEAKADLNLRNFFDATALMVAVLRGHIEIVKELLKAGANINTIDDNGNTALIEAVKRRSIEMVKILLDAGADISIKNKEGKTAVDIAKERRYVGIVKLLEEYLEQQKEAIKKHLPLLDVLQDITAEYLGYPIREKIVEKEESEVPK